MTNRGAITYSYFVSLLDALKDTPTSQSWETTLHPDTARQIDWYCGRPVLRRLYREAGYPFGRNQGAFKRWALVRGRYAR